MKIIRAKSAGFCFGVERAIGIARKCTDCGKNKVYTDGPLIHNRQMMERLKEEGILEIGDYQSSNELKNELSDRLAWELSRALSACGTDERESIMRIVREMTHVIHLFHAE